MRIDSDDSKRTVIRSADAPEAVGPYSPAIAHDGLLYCSGSLPFDPESGHLVDSSVAAETERCLANLAALCMEAGTDITNALRLTVYTTNLDEFAEINEAYAAYFHSAPPARVTVGVAALPKGVRVEIDAIVALR